MIICAWITSLALCIPQVRLLQFLFEESFRIQILPSNRMYSRPCKLNYYLVLLGIYFLCGAWQTNLHSLICSSVGSQSLRHMVLPNQLLCAIDCTCFHQCLYLRDHLENFRPVQCSPQNYNQLANFVYRGKSEAFFSKVLL